MKSITQNTFERKEMSKSLNLPVNTFEFLRMDGLEHAIFFNTETQKQKKVKLPYKQGQMLYLKEPFHLEKAVDHLPVSQAIAINPKVVFPNQSPTMILGKKRPASQLPSQYSRKYAVVKSVDIVKENNTNPEKLTFWRVEYTLDA